MRLIRRKRKQKETKVTKGSRSNSNPGLIAVFCGKFETTDVGDEPLRFDLLVDDCLLMELKAVEVLQPFNKAQFFSYMKLMDIPIGLLIDFHEPVLKNGIVRMILPGAKDTGDNQLSLSD